MRKWIESTWFWPVVAILLLIVLTRGQVLMALGPLSKFLIPVAGGYFLFRFVKRKLQQSLIANLHKTMNKFADAQQRQQSGHADEKKTVIEICPKCGEPKKAICPDCR